MINAAEKDPMARKTWARTDGEIADRIVWVYLSRVRTALQLGEPDLEGPELHLVAPASDVAFWGAYVQHAECSCGRAWRDESCPSCGAEGPPLVASVMLEGTTLDDLVAEAERVGSGWLAMARSQLLTELQRLGRIRPNEDR